MSDFLYHHGILGMRWGQRNGPPYPLGADQYSALEKKRKKSNNARGLSDKQKRYIKRGAIVAGVAIGTVGALAIGSYAAPIAGRYLAKKGLTAIGKQSVKMLDTKVTGAIFSDIQSVALKNGLKVNPELIGNTAANLKKTNPLNAQTNCPFTAVTGVLRNTHGIDVTAKGTASTYTLNDAIRNAFVVGDTAFEKASIASRSGKFFSSAEGAGQVLVKKFGDNASGVVGVTWDANKLPTMPPGSGHAFNFEIKNGVVTFKDFQQGLDHQAVSKYWNFMNQDKGFNAIRIDNLEPNWEWILKNACDPA